MSDITERTPSCTEFAHNQERCRTLMEAFADVGTGRFLAYRVQSLIPQNLLQPLYLRVIRHTGPNPGRLFQHCLPGPNFDRDAGGLAGAFQGIGWVNREFFVIHTGTGYVVRASPYCNPDF